MGEDGETRGRSWRRRHVVWGDPSGEIFLWRDIRHVPSRKRAAHTLAEMLAMLWHLYLSIQLARGQNGMAQERKAVLQALLLEHGEVVDGWWRAGGIGG